MNTREDIDRTFENVAVPLADTRGTGAGHSHAQRGHVANPDDPAVHRPPQGRRGPLPGPHYVGLEGRTAIVQGQVFVVAVIVIVQLWLCTDALYELLSGHPSSLGGLVLASGLGFVLTLITTFWPRRRVEGS